MADQITDNLLEKIGHGRLKMRPRWHFAMLAGLTALGFFMVFGITFFMVAFLTLSVRTSGMTELPGFGWEGKLAFLKDFPWFLALILLALMAALELYARRYQFSYKRPAMATMAVLVVVLGSSGFVLGAYVERICPEGGTMDYALGRMRSAAARRSGFVQRGTLIELRDDAAVIMDDEGAEREIPLTQETQRLNAPAPGDDIVIFGHQEAGEFRGRDLHPRLVTPGLLAPMHKGSCAAKVEHLKTPTKGGQLERKPEWKAWGDGGEAKKKLREDRVRP
jgi:hypothetical protein